MSTDSFVPNFTQIPNVFIEHIVPTVSEEAVRVGLVLCQETYGWAKENKQFEIDFIAEKAAIDIPHAANGLDALYRTGFVIKLDEKYTSEINMEYRGPQ